MAFADVRYEVADQLARITIDGEERRFVNRVVAVDALDATVDEGIRASAEERPPTWTGR